MKSLNVKKLAAIAAGAALVGSAVLPLALGAATVHTIEKSDIYDPTTGSPIVNAAVGANSGVGDALWAGNIVATIAKNAVVESTVTCTPSAGAGAGTCEVTLGNVELTVGGTVTYENAKDYKADLNSVSGSTYEFANKVLTDSQLPSLYNQSVSYKYNNTTNTITIQEKIGVNADALFDPSEGIQDLVLYLQTEKDLYYMVDLGSGIPVVEGEGTDENAAFTDDPNDNITVPFFGETYLVKEINLEATSPYIKLVKSREKQTYKTGESFTVEGKGDYAGQTLTVTVTQIVKTSEEAAYQVTLQLTDANGNVLDTQTVSSGATVDFQDAEGNSIVATDLYVETVAADIATNEGYVQLYVGASAIDLYAGKGYPYDPTETTPDWKVEFERDNTTWFSSSYTPTTDTRLTAIRIYNANLKYDFQNPLYAKNALASHDQTTASLPNNFATVELEGFETGKSFTTVQFGVKEGDMLEYGFTYYDPDDVYHRIPFYLPIGWSTSGATFEFDGQTYWFKAVTSGNDLNFILSPTDNTLNGWDVDFNTDIAGDCNIRVKNGTGNTGGNNWRQIAVNNTDNFNISGTVYTCTCYADDDLNCQAAVALQVRKNTETGDLVTGGTNNPVDVNAVGGGDAEYFFLGLNTLDNYLNFAPLNLEGANEVPYQYVPYIYNSGSTYRAYLLLNGGVDYSIQYPEGSEGLITLGGDINESNTLIYPFYVPDSTYFGRNQSDNDYFTAEFGLAQTNVLGFDTFVYINEATGKLHSLPNNNLDWPEVDVMYIDAENAGDFNLSSDTTVASNLQKAYTSRGSIYEIDPSALWFKAQIPESKLQVKMWVKSTTTEEKVTGGESLTAAEGETVTTSAGTKITVDKVNYSCTVTDGAAECTCTASPETYKARAPGDVKVYLDTEAPATKLIVVGGWIVNTLAPEDVLSPLITAEGDYVVYKDEATGNIYVAGYTAEDTAKAAQDLINQIEGFA